MHNGTRSVRWKANKRRLLICVPLLLVLKACDASPTGGQEGDDTGGGGSGGSGGSGGGQQTSAGNPVPDANDRMFLDTRQLFQQAQNIAQADCALNGIPASSCQSNEQETQKVGFTTNMDGQGTHALRMSWSQAGSCTDDGLTFIQSLSAPYPKRIYMQWKMHMGRTSTGGGLGALSSFDITNQNCGNAGRKMWLTLRDVPDRGNAGRLDYIWPGAAPVNPRFDGWGGYNTGRTFQPQDHVGQTITQTIYYQAESSGSANDGVMRLWINGQLLIDRTGLDMGPEGFHRFQFPTTFRAPIQDQTEYWWDFLAWEPIA